MVHIPVPPDCKLLRGSATHDPCVLCRSSQARGRLATDGSVTLISACCSCAGCPETLLTKAVALLSGCLCWEPHYPLTALHSFLNCPFSAPCIRPWPPGRRFPLPALTAVLSDAPPSTSLSSLGLSCCGAGITP